MMNRTDWIGAGTSLAVHLGLLLLLSLVQMVPEEPVQLGYVEVEMGPLQEARPVRETTPERERPAAPAEEPTTEPEPEALPEEAAEEPPTSSPVDPPDVVAEDEPIDVDEPEEGPPAPPQEEQSDEPAEEVGSDDELALPAAEDDEAEDAAPSTPESGEGTAGEASAPFQIEGLDRITMDAPLPRYASKVNATIKVRITVGPDGRVVQRFPLMKADPALEEAVMDALKRWRFNALPENAPQKSQQGVVTFRFRLQ